uniref:Uncharacterized protein n=1 Tax=Trichobilharzia regenti TaxID=157069 RepID=A0AA85JCR3_TRIRE|nr:unnamed protein product [Trichobilharzia regenti]
MFFIIIKVLPMMHTSLIHTTVTKLCKSLSCHLRRQFLSLLPSPEYRPFRMTMNKLSIPFTVRFFTILPKLNIQTVITAIEQDIIYLRRNRTQLIPSFLESKSRS